MKTVNNYNSSLIDANVLLPGDDTDKLPETYVIFITESDVLGGNKPIYHVQRNIIETDELFEDGSHILYVNGDWKDNSPLGLLMQDFACKNPEKMHYKILAERVKYFKEDEKGVKAMCKAVEELCNEEKRETRIDVAKKMLADGALTVEKIAEYSGLTVNEVKELVDR